MTRKFPVTGFDVIFAFCSKMRGIYSVHIFVVAYYAIASILFNDAVSCWVYMASMPIPVASRSKALDCGRSLIGVWGSNSAGFMVVYCECSVLSGRGLSVVSVVCCQVEDCLL
jgi:hypothetical protein